jgi:hypothetical protein
MKPDASDTTIRGPLARGLRRNLAAVAICFAIALFVNVLWRVAAWPYRHEVSLGAYFFAMPFLMAVARRDLRQRLPWVLVMAVAFGSIGAALGHLA